MQKTQKSFVLFGVIFVCIFCISCSKEKEVSFSKDIMPILQENCFSCHQTGGAGEIASGLNLESYENLMRGTKLGPVIQPGQSYASTIQVLVEHKAGDKVNMPKGGSKLADDKIELIGKWIDQGAKNN
jgi:hypothetical protein